MQRTVRAPESAGAMTFARRFALAESRVASAPQGALSHACLHPSTSSGQDSTGSEPGPLTSRESATSSPLPDFLARISFAAACVIGLALALLPAAAAALPPAFSRRTDSRGQVRPCEPAPSGSRRQSRGVGAPRSVPAARPRPGRWLAGACLALGLAVGVSDPAFAAQYTYIRCDNTTVTEGGKVSFDVIHWEFGDDHAYCVTVRIRRSYQANEASASDVIQPTGEACFPNPVGTTSVSTKQDSLDEGDETFVIDVNDGHTNGTTNRCTITIKDDDNVFSGTTPDFAKGALVSNVGKSSDSLVSFDNDVAQAFTTGSDPNGYTLTGVDLVSRGGSGTPAYEVYIAGNRFGGGPGAKLKTLTGTLPSGDGNARFEPVSSLHLTPNRKYWVVVDVSTTDGTTSTWGTNSNQQEAGTATGWTIANGGLSRAAASSTWQARSANLKIAVHGSAVGSTTPGTSSSALVSNTGQTASTPGNFSSDYAQAFTTGANAEGYKLTGADLDIGFANTAGSTDPALAVRIYTDSSATPGRVLGSLRQPSSLSAGVNRFEASFGGVDLDPGTTYWVVIDPRSLGNKSPTMQLTTSDAEDSGKAAGWSIADAGRSRTATGWTALGSSRALKIGIHGRAKAAEASSGTGASAVSNIGRPTEDVASFTKDYAQQFTAGSASGGYRLTKVDLDLLVQSGTPPGYSVTLLADSSDSPSTGTPLATLTSPASLSTGTNSFTAAGTGIKLDPNKKYWVVVDVTAPGNASVRWRYTEALGVDAGAGAGWDIPRRRGERPAAPTGTGAFTVSTTDRFKMAVHATATVAAPAAPQRPTPSRTDGNRLTLRWLTPAAWPPVTDYDVRYRQLGDTTWTEHDHTDGTTRATITDLQQGARFTAQVRATNSLGTSDWSDPAWGHTGPARVESAITDAGGSVVYVSFTKPLNPTGTSLDTGNFTMVVDGENRTPQAVRHTTRIDPEGRTVLTEELRIEPNFTDPIKAGQTVTVSYAVQTGKDRLRDIDSVLIADFSNTPVTNAVQGVPAAPSTPTVAVVGAGGLLVNWTAADGYGLPITDYDVRYYAGSTNPTDDDDWIEPGETGGHDHVGDGISAKLTGLAANTAYQVQVRAANLYGEGPWSASGTATTGATAPAAPAQPTVAAVSGSAGSLSVNWTAPDTGGSAITDYDLRYYAGSADPTDPADWVEEHESTGLPAADTATTATSWTVAGLAPSTDYRVQVRAGNAAGEGPWSASGTATTNASTSTTNNAPVRMMLGTSGCVAKTADTSFGTISVPAGMEGEASPLVDNTKCTGTDRQAPMFSDPDGDTLTFTARVSNLPDNVRLGDGVPIVRLATTSEKGAVVVSATAAYRQTDVRVDVTATDPEGASVSTFFRARVGALADTGAPTFAAQQGPLHVAENQAIDPVVLPSVSGGDLGSQNAAGESQFSYRFRVSGLPSGLTFDRATRTLTGTPTAVGTFEVTYTAADADDVETDADTATQTFTLRVGDGPRINRVRIVSHPTYDSDSDGTHDTYVRGDRILIDVEFGAGQPVKIGGEKKVRLRLDLGDKDASQSANRKVLTQYSQLYGDETLRFAYTVQAADTDPDGVWVQTGNVNQVLFTVGTTTLTDADTGAGAALNLSGLPTNGYPLTKVDGSKTSADIGPRPTGATVDGNTLRVTFNKALSTSVDTDTLKFYLAVQGAGGLNTGTRNARQHPDAISVSGSALTLTLDVPARADDDRVTLSYDGALLKGTDDKKVAKFRDLAVTNNTGGTAGPEPLRATVRGDFLMVVFDGALDETSAPAGSAFRVETSDADHDRRRIAGVRTATVDGTEVSVSLENAVRPGELAAVFYTKPDANPLKGAGTGKPEVLSFDHFHVRTVFDNAPPVLLGGAVVQKSATPPRSKLALYFDEPLDASSVPAGAFGVTASGGTTVSAVAVEDNSVVLTLDSRAPVGRAFRVNYTSGTNPIRDAAGNAVAAFTLTLSATAPGVPVAQSAVVDGARVVLAYDRPLDPASLPAPAAFTLHHTSMEGETEADRTRYGRVAAVEVAGQTAVLHLPHPILPCDGAIPFTVTYAVPDASPLQGLDGADADEFFAANVTNARSDLCDPDPIESAVEGSIILRARRPFQTQSPPQAAWFTVKASGGAVTVTGAAFSTDDPRELILTLSRDFVPGETATVSYRRPPGARGLWSADGRQFADVIDMPVTMRGAALAAAPAAPTVTQAADTSVTLNWPAPDADDQTAVTGYGVRYRRHGETDWTSHAHTGTGTSATIPGLAAGHRFETQVRATGPDGDSPWSESGWGHTGAARFESATTLATGRAVILAFTKDILIAGLHTDYTVLVGGERRQTRSAYWEDATVGLVLAQPLRWGEAVTVAYAKPPSGAMLSDADELAVASFGPETVANTVPQSGDVPDVLQVALVSNPGPHGIYGRGAVIRVALTFSEAVQVDTTGGTPSVLLKFDRDPTYPKKTAPYESGSGTDTLVFAFGPLAPPNHSSHGVALLADTLALNGGAVRSANSLQDAALAHTGLDHDAGHRIDSVLPSVDSAAVDGNMLTVVFDEALDPNARPAGNAFTVTAVKDSVPRRIDGTGTASVAGAAVTVALASAVHWGEALRAHYFVDRDPVRDLAGNTAPGFGELPAANLAPRPNRPATGAPAITGLAQVGETLTASANGIADPDGMTNAVLAWQWTSNDGGVDDADADIEDATASTYELAAADEGKTIRVRVSFTDDAGFAESLVSEPTEPVAAPPLTAEFVDVPEEHQGYTTSFDFGLVFSEDFPGRFDYKALRAAFQTDNGRVVGAKRVAQGHNQRWTITVRPWSHEAVTLTLPAGSVSTASGRSLANTLTATVTGPPGLSVADAEAREGEDAAVEFAVTLSRAPSGTVTVDYATADGTATAGEDYTAASGTLTFAAGESSKTVSVALLDDAIDEGEETFALKLSNAQGAHVVDGEATGTIVNTDHMPKAWTSRFGRTVAVHVVDAVEARLDEASGSWLQLGGHRLGGGPEVHEPVQRLVPEHSLWEEPVADPAGQEVTFKDLMLGSAFHLVSNPEGEATGPRLSAWGRVATSGFDGREDQVSLDGTVTTATLGVDGIWKRWLTGLVLAYSEGDGSFSHVDMPGGDLTSSLTSVHPYVAYTLSDRVRLWGLVGYGSGALQLRLEDRRAMDTDLTMTMGALGVRGSLLDPSQPGGLELALRSDVLWMVMDSAKADNLAATEAEASRLRLVLEGSRPVALAAGGSFTPSLEIGLRHDGGDAETGTGVEVGGSLRYASAWGLSIEASVRGLLAHEAQDYTEWGASGALRFDPGRQGKGLTASILPTWGSAMGGAERLWGAADARALAPAGALPAASAAARLDAELGYGLLTLRGRGLLTPYARVALMESADQAWHLGTRLALRESLNLSLEASRRAREGQAAAHELALRATLGW